MNTCQCKPETNMPKNTGTEPDVGDGSAGFGGVADQSLTPFSIIEFH